MMSGSGPSWVITVKIQREMSFLWEELVGLYSLWDVPWSMCGDFNITQLLSERLGDSSFSSAMEEFEFIFDLDLLNLPLVVGVSTWSNSQSWLRLDRFLVSSSWEVHYPELCQKRLPRVCSDHFPILLDNGGINGGWRYFKFKNVWLEVDGFVDKVRSWWSSY
ncbi:hypothetical protein CIPAW_06G068900 [Carya illinoinensis]|uniref:Endonuclease/exonuclease/phosphatase domain-containing protein n=1 Tax=Carya illinoinensis TaxID=32201 RepID=A0A8T1Q8S8_CARIL|nr:hypothetical protein CIPAW_06G068900 [Carya illinoinensis]